MVSIIVPVYNSEKYIERCILSVIKQTNPNWELIIVDDGSVDASKAIIKSLSEKDERIHYYYQKNSGAGMARNLGLSKATGKYIAFLDSDDYLSKFYVEKIMQIEADVIFLDVKRILKNKIVIEGLSKYSETSKNDLLRYQMTSAIPWGGCRKAVKRDLIIKNNIQYSNHHVGEEAFFSFQVLLYSKKISFIDYPVYNYCIRADSLSQTINADPWSEVCTNIRDKCKQIGVYEKYADTINAFFVVAAMVSIANMAKILQWGDFKKKATRKYIWMQHSIDSKYSIDIRHMNRKAMPIWLLMKVRFRLLLYYLCKYR